MSEGALHHLSLGFPWRAGREKKRFGYDDWTFTFTQLLCNPSRSTPAQTCTSFIVPGQFIVLQNPTLDACSSSAIQCGTLQIVAAIAPLGGLAVESINLPSVLGAEIYPVIADYDCQGFVMDGR